MQAWPCAHIELEQLRGEHLAFTSALGFGDGVTEPAAELADLIEPIESAFSDERDHIECPIICELCGEQLADTTCDHCHGSGCGPGTALGSYEECEWCAGAGKIHPGCVEKSYNDLAAERDEALAAIERVRELHEPLECPCGTCDVVICAECLSEAHPCPTIRALDGGECGE